ncbi:MAG: type III-A CRISPR-associated protein Csm2 [Raineya sp.]
MNGGKNQSDKNKNNNSKTFAELAKKGKEKFGGLETELLKFKESAKIDEIFAKTEEFVKDYAKNITTHQLRNIFQEIKKAKDLASLKLIRPNLAYIAGRLDGKAENAKSFVAFIDSLIKEVKDDKQLENFKDFMEAVVAYHKFHGSN